MRRTLFLILFSGVCICCAGQTYISLAPSLTNTAGSVAEKSNIAIELGRQWDVFSLGIDVGKTSLSKVTAGIGYIFNAQQNLMTELTSGIEYAHNDKLHINISFGQYFYSGRYAASNVTFFGISGMWYFSASSTGSLIKPKAKDPM
jgi:hypothetical protein